MKQGSALHILMTASLLAGILPATPAQAEPIAVSYSLTGTGTILSGTDTTLTLKAQATGSVSSGNTDFNAAWNPVTYSDLSVLNLTTSLLNGNFTLLFASGDRIFGTVFEDDSVIDASPSQTGPFPQTLTFAGGTGEFVGATGSVSGLGFLGATGFTVSGSGTLNSASVPEPASGTFLLGGLGILIVARRWSTGQRHLLP